MAKILFLLLISTICFAQKIHSHNDYLQKRPLWEAFEAGANSIEADVFLIEGKLLVAHQSNKIDSAKTLEKLYLKPLNQILKLRKRQQLQILIDIKTEAEPTLRAFIAEISKYSKLVKANSKKQFIKFIISGNRPPLEKYSSYPDFIFFDHQSFDGLTNQNNSKIAMVSFSFGKFSKWKGTQSMNFEEKLKLKSIIDSVHTLGYPIRFWATPDTPSAWEELHKLGVDFINTDRPQECLNYFSK